MLAKALSAATAAAAEKIYIESVFSTFLYTGNGSTQTITNGIDLAGNGGLVWLKSRNSGTDSHYLVDTARGGSSRLYSNNTLAANTNNAIVSFGSTGFSDTGYYGYASNLIASWTFRKAAKFFDVVTYTGNGAARAISHNLGSAPGCVIVKRTDSASFSWQVWHRSVTQTNQFGGYLNTTDAFAATGDALWGTPTSGTPDMNSSTFSLGTAGGVNASGGTYVAYLFAHDAGGFGDSGNDSVVSCGSFSTDGSGAFSVTLGWEPQWVMIKASSTTSDWRIQDSMRGMTTLTGSGNQALKANQSAAEAAEKWVTITSTGFGMDATYTNLAASTTYIYIAIRRGPMKTPTDATKVYSQYFGTPTDGTLVTTNFPVDFLYQKGTGLTSNWHVIDRLRGYAATSSDLQPRLQFNTTNAETSASDIAFAFDNVSYKFGNGGIATIAGISHAFRRAPGFFDVVAYTGTGVNRTVSHNLGVVPELMIVKNRSAALDWVVYSNSFYMGSTYYIRLNSNNASLTETTAWNDTSPTASVFTVGTQNNVNANGQNLIAYLFATCPGVSKCGWYTGTGTTKQINCGFTAGARFVLIKRTDSPGDWYVWDTARGIISGDDSYLLLNSSAAEVTNTDYIDPLNSGFEISSTAPAAINANGGSFIFLAIA